MLKLIKHSSFKYFSADKCFRSASFCLSSSLRDWHNPFAPRLSLFKSDIPPGSTALVNLVSSLVHWHWLHPRSDKTLRKSLGWSQFLLLYNKGNALAKSTCYKVRGSNPSARQRFFSCKMATIVGGKGEWMLACHDASLKMGRVEIGRPAPGADDVKIEVRGRCSN